VKLSNKGRYGVRALFDIALHGGGPTQIKEIAAREGIPARFLEQIFQDLKKAGLVGAKRGPRGGYHLARPAPEIKLGDVVRALEGPITIGGKDDRPARGRVEKPVEPRDVTDVVFRELSRRIETCFDELTIADMVSRGEELGLHRRVPHRHVYVI
jgi:Rrf2 family protein